MRSFIRSIFPEGGPLIALAIEAFPQTSEAAGYGIAAALGLIALGLVIGLLLAFGLRHWFLIEMARREAAAAKSIRQLSDAYRQIDARLNQEVAARLSSDKARALVEQARQAAELAQKQTIRQLRHAIEAITDGLALWDADDRLVLCNERYRDILAPVADRLQPGIAWLEVQKAAVEAGIYGDEDRPRILDSLRRMRVQTEDADERQLADGRWVTVIERRNSDGGSASLIIDISGRKGRENEMIEWWALLETQARDLDALTEDLSVAKNAAEQANRTKSAFLAGMSHELRTPLNAVLGFAEIIRDQLFGPNAVDRYAAYAADIYTSGVHLLALVNDVLDLSKIEAGRMELQEEPVDLERLISTAILLVQDSAQRNNILLRYAGTEPVLVLGDSKRLQQCLLNILSNAIKFTLPGGVVTLAIHRDAAYLTVEVSDTGIGIDPVDAPKIFEPFRQIDGALNRIHPGTGLGMALTRNFIELHQGRVVIDTAVGRGTVVQLQIPTQRVLADPVLN